MFSPKGPLTRQFTPAWFGLHVISRGVDLYTSTVVETGVDTSQPTIPRISSLTVYQLCLLFMTFDLNACCTI